MDADFINIDDLQTLINMRDATCVTIYLPMVRKGPDVPGNRIRYKNALAEVEEKLIEGGWRRSEVDDFLAAPRRLLEESSVWQHQLDGLAVYLTPDFFETYRLPVDFPSLVLLQDRFHIKPILPLFSDDGRFYILALSQNHVRLFQGTSHTVDELEIAFAPTSLAEAMRLEDPEAQLQHHTTTSGSTGAPDVVHHGHGLPDADELARLRLYFQSVSDGISRQLKGEEGPLVLAAVDYLHPLFKEVSDSPYLLDEGVVGNPDHMSSAELHAAAWPIVEPLFEEAKSEVTSRYHQLAESDQASAELAEIVPAAFQGRVDALFVAVGTQRWGSYDPDRNKVVMKDEPTNGAEDLLDFAAVQTLANGGTVYAVSPEEVPGEKPVAAVFRY